MYSSVVVYSSSSSLYCCTGKQCFQQLFFTQSQSTTHTPLSSIKKKLPLLNSKGPLLLLCVSSCTSRSGFVQHAHCCCCACQLHRTYDRHQPHSHSNGTTRKLVTTYFPPDAVRSKKYSDVSGGTLAMRGIQHHLLPAASCGPTAFVHRYLLLSPVGT